MQKFYKCKKCGDIIIKLKDSGSRLSCCNDDLEELTLNSTEASNEKHLPKVSFSNNLMNISIGEITHPMTEEHLIEWVYIEYSNGGEFAYLNGEPFITLNVLGKVVKNVYSYCNLHGLWYSEIKE